MPKLTLGKSELSLIKTILRNIAPHSTVWAYGSRVTGHCHEGSDLDLVIRNESHLDTPSPVITVLKTTRQDSSLPFLVDIMDWALLPESYQQEIEKHHIVLQ